MSSQAVKVELIDNEAEAEESQGEAKGGENLITEIDPEQLFLKHEEIDIKEEPEDLEENTQTNKSQGEAKGGENLITEIDPEQLFLKHEEIDIKEEPEDLEENTQTSLYKCDLCDYVSKRNCNLQQHISTQHHRKNPENLEDNNQGSLYKCDLCDYVSNRSCNLQRHISAKHLRNNPETIVRCDLKYFFKRDIECNYSIRNHKKVFYCKYCDHNTICKYDLVAHMRIHYDEKPYVCGVCQLRFTYHCKFTDHLTVHNL